MSPFAAVSRAKSVVAMELLLETSTSRKSVLPVSKGVKEASTLAPAGSSKVRR